MPRRTSPRLLAVLALSSAVLLVHVAGGCKDESKEGRAANTAGAPAAVPPVPADMTVEKYEGVSVAYPKGWTARKSEEGNALEINAPLGEEEAKWLPGVSLEIRSGVAATGLDLAMGAAVDGLRRSKTGFQLKDKQVLTHPAGFQYGRIEYTNLSAEQVEPLTQWELLIPMPGDKRLIVSASALTESWPTYQPEFTRIVDSIRLPGTGG